MSRVTKSSVLKATTETSQAALAVNSALRAHGWRTRWKGGTSVESDNAWRREQLMYARNAARYAARSARASLELVEQYVDQQLAVLDGAQGS